VKKAKTGIINVLSKLCCQILAVLATLGFEQLSGGRIETYRMAV
jgi:hypothetical protein